MSAPSSKASADAKSGSDSKDKKSYDVEKWFQPWEDDGTEFGLPGVVKNVGYGGSKATNKEELAKQRGVLTALLKKMGRNIMEGKSIINISLPVSIFEPRSFLERITDVWCYLPCYLPKAAVAKEPIERLKWVVTFVVSGLFRGVKQMKPFNPLLGETWQATYADGTAVFMEQSSHHPPVSSFQVWGPAGLYKYWGSHEYQASFTPNGIVGGQLGANNIEFADGTRIVFNLPHVSMSGLVMGERVFNYVDKNTPIRFTDEKNNLRCELKFHPDEVQGLMGWIKSAKTSSDTLRGVITRNEITLNDGSVERDAEKMKQLSRVSGSWLEGLSFDDKPYWTMRQYKFWTPIPADGDDVLPSDSRFREDLQALKKGDLELADKMKSELEERQRADKKNRQARMAERIARLEAEAAANDPVQRSAPSGISGVVERFGSRF